MANMTFTAFIWGSGYCPPEDWKFNICSPIGLTPEGNIWLIGC